jgi:methionine aminotransferase
MIAMKPVLLCNANPVRVALNDDYTPNWEIIEKHVQKTK